MAIQLPHEAIWILTMTALVVHGRMVMRIRHARFTHVLTILPSHSHQVALAVHQEVMPVVAPLEVHAVEAAALVLHVVASVVIDKLVLEFIK